MRQDNEQYGCIEIGTSTIKAAIGRLLDDGTLEVSGLGTRPSLKMLKGEPSNPAIVAEQLCQAMESARRQAGLREFPRQSALMLSGPYIRPQILHRTMELPGQEPISDELQQKLYLDNCAEAKAQEGDGDHLLDTIVERMVRLDGERIVFSAAGLYAVQADFETYCFLFNDASFQNFASVVTQAGYPWNRVKAVLYAPLAVASGLFPPSHSDESLGLAIDLGAGVTDFVMPAGPGYVVCEQIAVGCDNIANDLSIVLDLDIATARRIVGEMASLRLTAIPNGDGESRKVELNLRGVDGTPQKRLFSADLIEQVIHARLRETFELVKLRLEELDAFNFIGNEVLLSGGGAMIPRVTELASQVFSRKARVALPYRVVGAAEDAAGDPRNNAVLGMMRAFRQMMAVREIQDSRNGWGGLMDKLEKIKGVLKW